MERLRAFLQENGIQWEDERFCENYFRGVEPVHYFGIRFTYGIQDAEGCRQAETIRRFVKRSGKYEIFQGGAYPGCQWFCVALKADRDAARLYRSFSEPSMRSCEKEIHVRREMGIKNYAAEEACCCGIMEYWQDEYKKALASA